MIHRNHKLKTWRKVAKIMKAIDVRGLPEEQAKLIAEFVDFLKQRLKPGQTTKKNKRNRVKPKRIQFATHPSDVKGKLTREEIYDHL